MTVSYFDRFPDSGGNLSVTDESCPQLLVTAKRGAEANTYDDEARGVEESLQNLGLGYISMMPVHSSQSWADFRGGDYAEGNREAWRAIENAYRDRKIRAIGVSNFKERDIENILSNCSVIPMANQLLAHIGNTSAGLVQ